MYILKWIMYNFAYIHSMSSNICTCFKTCCFSITDELCIWDCLYLNFTSKQYCIVIGSQQVQYLEYTIAMKKNRMPNSPVYISVWAQQVLKQADCFMTELLHSNYGYKHSSSINSSGMKESACWNLWRAPISLKLPCSC